MAHSVFWKVRHYAAFFYDNIVAGVLSFRYIVIWYVWNGAELGDDILFCLCLNFFERFVAFFYCSNLFLYFFSFFFVPLLHQRTNLS